MFCRLRNLAVFHDGKTFFVTDGLGPMPSEQQWYSFEGSLVDQKVSFFMTFTSSLKWFMKLESNSECLISWI